MVKWNILRRRQFLIAPTGARIITKMSQLYLISYGTNRMLLIGTLIATRSNLIMPMINRKLFVCFHIQNYRNKYKGLQYEIRGKKDYANCIPYSQAVTHPSTNGTRRSLTSGSWRDRVRSTWYGRWQWNSISKDILSTKIISNSDFKKLTFGLWNRNSSHDISVKDKPLFSQQRKRFEFYRGYQKVGGTVQTIFPTADFNSTLCINSEKGPNIRN